jgi:DNA-binding NtrC family response regulator
VVEDEFMIRDYLSDYLRDAGYSVIAVSDAAQAISILEADRAVDLVFTDIMLPGAIDGFGLVQWLRPRSPDLPIVLTSGGHNAAKAAEVCKDEPFISKPYDLDALVSCFQDLLARGKPKS